MKNQKTNQTSSTERIIGIVGVGFFMLLFLSVLERFINSFINQIFIVLPIDLGYPNLIMLQSIVSLVVVIGLFFFFVKFIKNNWQKEKYLKNMFVGLFAGVVIMDLINSFVFPFTQNLLTNLVGNNMSNGSGFSNLIYMYVLGLIWIIKIAVFFYVFYQNFNLSESKK
ncbi:hypothetical protein Fleli_3898 [Bernardetia litoralis DSM 6794]|uniref:Uncharacterized protein n=1 Tax=Bernardetia litoralis (strain ATCC 23117 / DSM 6794 / NBRC 15988 / NCIMB 1366 / Fx l1 / Sio-4) TaxID=880071 RepID=I4AQG6_BERLS|nr:hypothetical protein [Bernardetia litoralis]AFM06201.1 hypothetical protein Fleli_3898 [Bernardetia litoralis DSM 6794]